VRASHLASCYRHHLYRFSSRGAVVCIVTLVNKKAPRVSCPRCSTSSSCI
jgi:hypothetical protein